MKGTELKRREAEAARNRLASTVGELGKAVDDTVLRAKEQARTFAPAAAGGTAVIGLLKLMRRRKRRRSRD